MHLVTVDCSRTTSDGFLQLYDESAREELLYWKAGAAGCCETLHHWLCYLEDARKVTISTDHKPNTSLSSKPAVQLTRRQVRWEESLSRFDFTSLEPICCFPMEQTSCVFDCCLWCEEHTHSARVRLT